MEGGRRSSGVDVPGLVITAILVVMILAPIATVFLWAFAESWFYPALLPTRWGLRFWNMILARADVWAALKTSIALSIVVTALSAILCLPAAYAFARLRFPGRQLLLTSFLLTQAFPRFGIYIAIAAIFLRLGLVGTFAGVVLIQLLNTLLFMIWIPVGAFQAIDRRLEEAARDVGANAFQVFFKITLPQARPAIAAALVLTFVSTFYETEGAFLIGVPHIRTMPVLMLQLINNQLVIQYGAVLSVLLWVPSFLAMFFARRILSARTIAAGFGA
jgi:putative spermidine/putrescine transport system permease protein